MARPVDSQCSAFQCAIEVLGRPWTALILNVLQAAPLRFSELAEMAKGPGDKILSARVRVTYSLTECGRAFEGVAVAIERWGRTFENEPAPSPATSAKSKPRRTRATRG